MESLRINRFGSVATSGRLLFLLECQIAVLRCFIDGLGEFGLVLDDEALLGSGGVLHLNQVALRVDVGVLAVYVALLICLEYLTIVLLISTNKSILSTC